MILKELKIDTWIGDPTNCYIILDEKSKELMVIDPAGDVDKIQEMIKILDGKLKYIYLTHCHGDHIFGVTELKKNCGGKILIHRMDAEGLNDAAINLTPYIREENIELEAGRTDVPTGSLEDIMDSITKKLMVLPNETIVYPGHGLSTRIKDEKPIYLELKPKLI